MYCSGYHAHLEVMDIQCHILVAGGLLIGQSDCFSNSIEEGGAATGELGGVRDNHLETFDLKGRGAKGRKNGEGGNFNLG